MSQHYDWWELEYTSAAYLLVGIRSPADNLEAPYGVGQSVNLFVGVGDGTNSGPDWTQTASLASPNTSYLPITSVHPLTIEAAWLEGVSFTPGNYSKIISITKRDKGNNIVTDTYRVLDKNGGKLVIIPESAGVIFSASPADTYTYGVLTVNGINLTSFTYSTKNNINSNTTSVPVSSYNQDFTKAYILVPSVGTQYSVQSLHTRGTPATITGIWPLTTLYFSVNREVLEFVVGLIPRIVSVTPDHGLVNTLVTVVLDRDIDLVTRVDLLPVTSGITTGAVTLPSSQLTVVNPRTLAFPFPDLGASPFTTKVVVRYSSGAGLVSSTTFFHQPPVINQHAWTSADGGNFFVTGRNLWAATTVKINGVPVRFLANITAYLNAVWISPDTDTQDGLIEITTPGGTVTSLGPWKRQSAPTISSFTPTSGLSGASVIITGTNFTTAHGDTTSAVTNVRFGSVYATYDNVTSTSIRAFVPPSGNGAITVNTSGGQVTSVQTFTQVFPPSGELRFIISSGAGDQPVALHSGQEYYIYGGSLDTMLSVRFKYLGGTRTSEYPAIFSVVSSSLVRVTIPVMDNAVTGGPVYMIIQNAYDTTPLSQNTYNLLPAYTNINYPTISTYATSPTNNTTPVTTTVGTNLYFENTATWEKAADIYFAKPVTRHDGLSDNAEWTRAIAGWFCNNGEWQQFWPSVENAAKKFYKFDWSVAGITDLVDVIKVVPDYPNLYMLLSTKSPPVDGYYTDAKSLLAKVNMLTGAISYVEMKGVFGTNTCHISDIHVSGDSVYAVGYDFQFQQNTFGYDGYAINRFISPARFVENVNNGAITPAVNRNNLELVANSHLYLTVKKYSKSLGLQFSRKMVSPVAFDAFTDPRQQFFFKAMHTSNFNGNASNDYYITEGSLNEPKITILNGAVYVLFPSTELLYGSQYFENNTYAQYPIKEQILVKKLKTSNLTEYVGETQVRLLSSNIRLPASTVGELGYNPTPQFEFFRPQHKSGFNQYTVFADPQLNGNNKITFLDGFYWNSLQINPTIKSAFVAKDGVFNYATVIGDLESGTGDDSNNGMLVGLYAKDDTYYILCGTESEAGKVPVTTGVEYSEVNSFLSSYPSLLPAYTPTSFPVTAFVVTETVNDNGGTGYPMTQVCNA